MLASRATRSTSSASFAGDDAVANAVSAGHAVILDAERYIERVRPPDRRRLVAACTKLVGVLPKGKGALLQTESELDASGTLLYWMQAASFAVGASFKGAACRTLALRSRGTAKEPVVPAAAEQGHLRPEATLRLRMAPRRPSGPGQSGCAAA